MEAIYQSTENNAGFPVKKQWSAPSLTLISKKIIKNGTGQGNETYSTGFWAPASGAPGTGKDFEGFSSANNMTGFTALGAPKYHNSNGKAGNPTNP